jgi:predicted alpha/beta superfamily hydrolase
LVNPARRVLQPVVVSRNVDFAKALFQTRFIVVESVKSGQNFKRVACTGRLIDCFMDTRVDNNTEARTLLDWQDYRSYFPPLNGHHISGTIRVAPAVHSPQLDNARDLLVYLPPSYHYTSRRYPVIYMHDGQNLFDNTTSYAGEWGVDETMEQMSYQEGLEAIIVGIPNVGMRRMAEYNPFGLDQHLAGGDQYLAFIVDTIKPVIDQDFRTLPERKTTGLMGSSLGGLISLYGFFRYGAVFGFAGVMSPSLWIADNEIFAYVAAALYRPGKIYLDVGTRELGEQANGRLHRAAASRRYYADVRRMKGVLVKKGYRPLRDLYHVEEKLAGHNESSWGRRLAPALRFLLTEALRETSG